MFVLRCNATVFSFHLQPLAIPYLVGTLGQGRAEKELLQLMTPLVGELEKKLKGQGHLVGVSLQLSRIQVKPQNLSLIHI